MNLPVEVRVIIYGHALSYDGAIKRVYNRKSLSNSKLAALLQVCKLIEEEAAPIFYSINLFLFSQLSPRQDLRQVCRAVDMPERYISHLRKLILLRYWSRPQSHVTHISDIQETLECLSISAPLLQQLSLSIYDRKAFEIQDVMEYLETEQSLTIALEPYNNLETFTIAVGLFKSHGRISDLRPQGIGKESLVCNTIGGFLELLTHEQLEWGKRWVWKKGDKPRRLRANQTSVLYTVTPGEVGSKILVFRMSFMARLHGFK